jgi:hypothetical protein
MIKQIKSNIRRFLKEIKNQIFNINNPKISIEKEFFFFIKKEKLKKKRKKKFNNKIKK